MMRKLKYYLMSNRFYHTLLRPFDRILYPLVPHEQIAAERRSGKIGLNKVAHIADVENPDWNNSSRELGEHYWCIDKPDFHRKLWEYNQILMSLRRAGYLYRGSIGLSVGAGHEPLLYYLTHKINRIVGIDLYESSFFGGEDGADTVEAVEKYAPYPYDKTRIELRRMDARRMVFPDGFFDFAFSVSSIEHFGRMREIKRALAEIHRVLKPGGLLVVTTELKLNRLGTSISGATIFSLKPLLRLFHRAGFSLFAEDIDLRIEREYLEQMTKLPEEALRRPHIILRFFNTVFTSLNLVWKKQGNEALRGEEASVSIPRFRYDAGIQVELEKKEVFAGEEIRAKVMVENRGDFNWYVSGMSHRIALAVKLCDATGKVLDENFCDAALPANVPAGDKLQFVTLLKTPPQAGSYRYFFDMKKELITWFFEKGSRPLLVDFQVRSPES